MGFRDDEKKRYKSLKPEQFPPEAQPPGTYNGQPRDFCLADGHSDENLHESIRDEVIRYFADRGIPWHDGQGDGHELPSNHLCCSQSCCVNTLAPMMRDAELLASVFRIFLPELQEALPYEADKPLPDGSMSFLAFEWIGTRNYLGETSWGTQGANATSADFSFRFRRYDGRIHLVLGEWKYTEAYGKLLPEPDKLNKTRLRVYREAFNRWKQAQPDLPDYEQFFIEPFYQLMRQTLLAREMELAARGGDGEMGADIVSVIHVAPDANKQFTGKFTSPVFEQYGRTVTSAWERVAPKGRFKSIPAESLMTAIEQVAGQSHRAWSDWLLRRYGWWRG